MANTVFVGLSGGVDSSVSAALLKDAGYSVVGVFIKIWQPEFLECTWAKDRLDAMRVAAALGIPFREIDLSEQYKKEVVGEMIRSYAAGETPNPDVTCNRSIKFGAFASWARDNGANAVATGHYARVRKAFGGAQLLRGVDSAKDQSYFLYRLNSDELLHTMFPVGEMKKEVVRAKARRYNLPVAAKADSQGLCFVGDVSMRDFLKRFIPVEQGDVLDESGRKIGVHDGAALYTIGQRHGFSVSGKASASPHYVVYIDASANTITASPDKMRAALTTIVVRNVHWIGEVPATPARFLAQARYHEKEFPVTVAREGERATLTFDEPHVVSPGQSIVFYDGDRCVGGAVITKSVPKNSSTVHSGANGGTEAVQ